MGGTTLVDRTLIRLSGEDVRGFLQGLLTNDLTLLAPDRPLWAGLLTPQGKALFDLILWDDGDAVLIDTETAQAAKLARRLMMYRLRRPIAIELASGAVHWSIDGACGVTDPRLPELGRRWLGAPTDPAVGWTAHRLSLGVAEGVADLGDGQTLWLECNAGELGGVSFAKGCYVGQENTARMHHRAKVNRRLVVAPIEMDGSPQRSRYPEFGVMIDLRKVDMLGDALVPAWLAGALTLDQRPTAV